MKKPLLSITIGGGLAAIGIFLVFTFLLSAPTQKYDISVNPIIVKDEMGIETHVMIKNTGINPLTNVKIDYGGTAKPDMIPLLNPGDKISLSPPQGSDLSMVRVTADQGVNVTQPYREPASAPFIGNSGYGG
ncbi:MAG TPA: hypothetical protein VJR22_04660 [Candidatus Nitrosotalea sp.]|nr:hypothetical protein [Nitrososphaerota archaeon]HKU33116.1 hypothetical protein [Candidatus Nitrosotalea sp.]